MQLTRRGFVGALVGALAAVRVFGAQVPDWTIREKEELRPYVQEQQKPVEMYVRVTEENGTRTYRIYDSNQRTSPEALGEYVYQLTGKPVRTDADDHVFIPGGYEFWS